MVQTVSQAFTDASLNSDTMIPVVSAQIALLDNTSISASVTPSATSTADASLTPASKGVNGVTVPDRKWAFADPFTTVGAGARCLADGTCYPMDPSYEAGWWGGVLSDGSGNVTSTTFTITYGSASTLSQIFWYADSYLGYPVNFTVDYTTNGSTWNNLATVSGYASTSWFFNQSLSGVLGIRITITKINYPQMYPVLLEFGGGMVIDISTTALKSFSILQERNADAATSEVGNVSAGSTELHVENSDGRWGPHNTSSPYSGLLRSNRKIIYEVGFQGTELIPLGTYYTMRWTAPGGGPEATVQAQDRMKKLRDYNYETGTVQQNQTVDVLIAAACQAAGLGVNEYITYATTVTIPYAWPNPTQSFLQYISDLAAAAGGVIYFDSRNRLIFQDAIYLHNNNTTPVMTITDSNALISSDDTWDEGEVKNKIVVQVAPLKLQSSATIWNLQTGTTWTVPAGGTLTKTIILSGPALGPVASGTLTAPAGVTVQSFTPYAASAVVVFANSSGSPQTITGYTVTGQLLIADGGSSEIAEDVNLEHQDGTRTMTITNRFVQRTDAAQTIATNLLTLKKNPPAKLKIETIGLPQLEMGDCITVNSAQQGVNGNYWVIRHEFAFREGGFSSQLDVIAVV